MAKVAGPGAAASTPDTHSLHLHLLETGAAGLGNVVARGTLLAILLLILIYTLTTSDLGGALWHASPAGAIGAEAMQIAAGIVGAVVLTRTGNARLRPRDAVVVAVCAVLVATVVVQFSAPEPNIWAFNYSSFLSGMLIARGNWLSGGAGSVAVVAIGTSWALGMGAPPNEIGLVVGIPMLGISICTIWAAWFSWILEREQRDQFLADRAMLEERAAHDAMELSRIELRAVQRGAAPILQDLASGAVLDDALHERIIAVESGIRDGLRAPWLRHPMLMAAISRARQRGATVLVVGELSEGEPLDPVGHRLARAVSARLDAAETGASLTIRLLPPHAAGRLSLVVRATQNLRVTFGADGTELRVS